MNLPADIQELIADKLSDKVLSDNLFLFSDLRNSYLQRRRHNLFLSFVVLKRENEITFMDVIHRQDINTIIKNFRKIYSINYTLSIDYIPDAEIFGPYSYNSNEDLYFIHKQGYNLHELAGFISLEN